MTATALELEGLTLYGTDPGGGDVFVFRTVTGLLDGPSVRREEVPRNGHGNHESPGTRGSRLVVAEGWWRASTEAGVRALRDQFMGVLADGGLGVLTHDELGVELTLTVELFGDQRFSRIGSSGRGDWTLKLDAPNPRMFGETTTIGPGASLSVAHAGNFPASPLVTVAGPVSAPYTVASDGHSVTVTQALGSGHTHTIDMATGWVYLDDVLQSGVTSALDVFEIPVGATVTVTGPSSMTVDVVDTYI